MAEVAEYRPTPLLDIVADGDVILVVGPEKIRLRVHSLNLKATSKPFFAMLGPIWKEGRDLLQDGSVELPLPEDNAKAMEYICAIIHHQNKMLPLTMAPFDILEVAIVADKYDLVDALRFASESWLHAREVKPNELMVLTAAAYAFQNAKAFKNLTRALILDYEGSYLSLTTDRIESVLNWRIFCLLEEQRNFARLTLGDVLIGGITSGGVCLHKCGWTSKYAYAYLESLRYHDLWPTGLINISEAIKRAERIPDPIPKERSTSCTYEYKHMAPEYREGRRWAIDNLREHVGLCLHCAQKENPTSAYCELSH